MLEAGGYALDELRGRSFLDFLEPDAAGEARVRFAAPSTGRNENYRAKQRFRAHDEEYRDAELSVSVVRDGGTTQTVSAGLGCGATFRFSLPR